MIANNQVHIQNWLIAHSVYCVSSWPPRPYANAMPDQLVTAGNSLPVLKSCPSRNCPQCALLHMHTRYNRSRSYVHRLSPVTLADQLRCINRMTNELIHVAADTESLQEIGIHHCQSVSQLLLVKARPSERLCYSFKNSKLQQGSENVTRIWL